MCSTALLLLVLGPATAAPRPAAADRVRVDGATCGVALVDRVRAQLGDSGPPSTDGPTRDESADAVLQQRPDGQWQLDLVISGPGAPATERTFVAPQCDTVMDAAAFVIAVAFDPARVPPSDPVAEPSVPPPAEPVDPAAASSQESRRGADASTDPAPTTAVPVVAPRVRRRRAGGFVRAGGGLDFGALPGAAAVFEVVAGARGTAWRVEALASYRLQSIDRAALDRDAGGRFWSWATGARGCGVPTRRALEFPICAGLDAGQLVAEGFGFPGARTTRRPWVAATASPGFAWAVHPHAALATRLEIGVPLFRTEIAIDNLEVLHRVGPAYGRVWIGVEGRFP